MPNTHLHEMSLVWRSCISCNVSAFPSTIWQRGRWFELSLHVGKCDQFAASEWLQVITTFKGHCRTWNGNWGFGPRRCLQSWHTFARVVHREEAFWWYVQKGFGPPLLTLLCLSKWLMLWIQLYFRKWKKFRDKNRQ